MKVKELIEKLQKLEPDRMVIYQGMNGYMPVYSAIHGVNELDGLVILDGFREDDEDDYEGDY